MFLTEKNVGIAEPKTEKYPALNYSFEKRYKMQNANLRAIGIGETKSHSSLSSR